MSILLRTKWFIIYIIAFGLTFVAKGAMSKGQNEKQASVKEFSIVGHIMDVTDYRFNDSVPGPTLKVEEGDRVRIIFSVPEGDIAHALYINEFDVKSPTVNPGRSKIIEFVANQKGEFIYYCPLPSHQTLGMEGKFVVE